MSYAKLPLRKVQLRDGLMVVGDKGKPLVFRDGLQMLGDHSSANRRHWRATASAFAILDQNGSPMVWIEGSHGDTQVVGEMACTVAKPTYAGRSAPGLVEPRHTDVLKWFEVVKDPFGVPVIRTWWAQGANVDRTCRTARDEVLGRNWRERISELLTLMGVGGMR